MSREVVEEITSEDAQWRVEIVARPDGTYSVEYCRWYVEKTDAGDIYPGFWSPISGSHTITDSLDIARNLGREFLKSCPR